MMVMRWKFVYKYYNSKFRVSKILIRSHVVAKRVGMTRTLKKIVASSVS